MLTIIDEEFADWIPQDSKLKSETKWSQWKSPETTSKVSKFSQKLLRGKNFKNVTILACNSRKTRVFIF